MADRARSTYLRPPAGDPIDPEVYSLREAAVRGAARCVAAGMRTYVPASLGPDVLEVLSDDHEFEVLTQMGDPDGETWMLTKVYR
jgi:hypothetical protein